MSFLLGRPFAPKNRSLGLKRQLYMHVMGFVTGIGAPQVIKASKISRFVRWTFMENPKTISHLHKVNFKEI